MKNALVHRNLSNLHVERWINNYCALLHSVRQVRKEGMFALQDLPAFRKDRRIHPASMQIELDVEAVGQQGVTYSRASDSIPKGSAIAATVTATDTVPAIAHIEATDISFILESLD